jgi:hypothetical protein
VAWQIVFGSRVAPMHAPDIARGFSRMMDLIRSEWKLQVRLRWPPTCGTLCRLRVARIRPRLRAMSRIPVVPGAGEAGATGSPPAVVNAVLDALGEWGVRHLDMPLTPEKVWQAIHG